VTDDHAHDEQHEHVHDEACAMAHGTTPAPTDGRRLVAVFASPVARELAHTAGHVGFQVVVLEPDLGRDGAPYPTVRTTAAAHVDGTTDVVVTDHDRAELGPVLAELLATPARWVGLMGKASIVGPHIAALRALGVDDATIARVHRPIGLDIGSRSPAEIAVSTVAGLLADRNGRAGGSFEAVSREERAAP
jgi:xanthine/CO dehydrogenase XdhC/CoxF family maturation factor